MDEKMNFSKHVNVMVGNIFAVLGLIRTLSIEFRNPYTLRSLRSPYTRCSIVQGSPIQVSRTKAGNRTNCQSTLLVAIISTKPFVGYSSTNHSSQFATLRVPTK
jgi:hypothetical protein